MRFVSWDSLRFTIDAQRDGRGSAPRIDIIMMVPRFQEVHDMQKTPTFDNEYSKQYVDSQKLVFDYIKHITTLDTGTIILLTVLLEKFFRTPQWKCLIVIAFLGFIVSIVALTLAAFGIIRSVRTPQEISLGLVRFTSWNFILGILGFITGILAVGVFAAKNWS
jgi:F0F1-type ATP synthase assembly protein I